jgi:hypothetical protein
MTTLTLVPNQKITGIVMYSPNGDTFAYSVGEEIPAHDESVYTIGSIRLLDTGIVVIYDEDAWPRINVLSCTVISIALSAGGVN